MIRFGADLNLFDDNDWTALLKAVDVGNVEIVQLIVKVCAVVNILGHDDYIPLMRAAFKGNDEIARILLDNSAELELENSKRWEKHQERWTALTLAASSGFESVVKRLLMLAQP